MAHWRVTTWIVANLALAAVVAAVGSSTASFADETVEPKPAYAWPGEVAPELERIRRELGGSAVDRFEALKDPATPHWAPDRDRNHDGRRPNPAEAKPSLSLAPRWERPQVQSLREVASQLDMAANRLEGLELYNQADALREQAQRLRVDARSMIGDGRGPAAMSDLRPARALAEPRLAPSLVPTPAPENEPPAATTAPTPLQE